MRSLSILALALLFNVSTAFAAPLEISKFASNRALDGRWQACTVEAHQNRTSWVLESASVQSTAENKIRVTGKAVFVRCIRNPKAENDTTVAPVIWAPANPYDSTSHQTPAGRNFTKRFDRVELLLASYDSHVLSRESVNKGSEFLIDQEITIDQFLTANQVLDLQDGKPVLTRIFALPRAIALITYEGQAEQSLGVNAWGSYALSFQLQKR